MNNIVGSEPQQLRRRTVVKGAAWAAPVVTMGVAAPSLAATPPPVAPSVGQGSCKHTKGTNRYHIELIFSNSMDCETTVNISSFVVQPFSDQPVYFNDDPIQTNFDLPANGSLSWEYDSDVTGNIANGTVDVVYTYTDCTGAVVEETQSIAIPTLPPCDEDYPHNGSGDTDAAKSDTEDSETTSTDSESSSTSSSSSSTTESSTQESTTEAPSATSTEAPTAESTSTTD